MPKAYLTCWDVSDNPNEGYSYSFDHDPTKAISYNTEEEADIDCSLLMMHEVHVTSPQGEKYRCTTFKTEKRAANEFVIFCDLPWEPQPRSKTTI